MMFCIFTLGEICVFVLNSVSLDDKFEYARQEFVEKVAMVRGALPELGLTTDLIVGFPGETEENFEDSLKNRPSQASGRTPPA